MKYPYAWRLADGYGHSNGFKVFSTFACGGGSTMGYKLAGFEVLGCCEIDQQMLRIYEKNHKPRFPFLDDIRNFRVRTDLPPELYSLDILDGSPPCSTFSLSGNREADWGKLKSFREGQSKQRLDDLFFEFVELTRTLRPKVAVAENVKGLLAGNAKGYVKEIAAAFKDAGYDIQVFLLNSASMGVPQRRERTFFIARRLDLELSPIKLVFNQKPIVFGEFAETNPSGCVPSPGAKELIDRLKPGDRTLAQVCKRLKGKDSWFNHVVADDKSVCPTITSGGSVSYIKEKRLLSVSEMCRVGTFPLDYDFGDANPKYVIGMSVPPVMIAAIADEIRTQWLERG